jgi:hypothetical protein
LDPNIIVTALATMFTELWRHRRDIAHHGEATVLPADTGTIIGAST